MVEKNSNLGSTVVVNGKAGVLPVDNLSTDARRDRFYLDPATAGKDGKNLAKVVRNVSTDILVDDDHVECPEKPLPRCHRH